MPLGMASPWPQLHPLPPWLPPSAPADLDAQYKPDAERGVLRRWAERQPGELEHQVAVGRLLAGEEPGGRGGVQHALALPTAAPHRSYKFNAHMHLTCAASPQATTCRRWSRCM